MTLSRDNGTFNTNGILKEVGQKGRLTSEQGPVIGNFQSEERRAKFDRTCSNVIISL